MNIADAHMEQAAFLAHEIKNPLAIIRAAVQLIEIENKNSNHKKFEIVYSEIDAINKIVYEHIENIKSTEKEESDNCCDVVEVFEKVIDRYSTAWQRDFDYNRKVKKASISCRRELVESLFENIIKNAVEATNNGEKIIAEINKKERKVVVTIADLGCGMSDDDLARIGELFYTTKKGGSGVGLFMCKRIAEQNGGRFSVVRNEPKATKVMVELNME